MEAGIEVFDDEIFENHVDVEVHPPALSRAL